MQSDRNLFRDLILGLAANLIILALTPVIPSGYGLIAWGMITATCLFLAYMIAVKYRRLIKLIRAGGTGYYYSFDIESNYDVLKSAGNEFCYLGISGNSILELFRRYISENRGLGRYRFLLMNPDASSLRRQVAFEKGVGLDVDLQSLNEMLTGAIESEVAAARKAIRGAIEVLRSLHLYREGKLEIRLYDAFIPWWMHIVDNRTIYLGVLEKGKRGLGCPVMTLTRHPEFASPFDPFKNTWDNMWANGTNV